jgi:putative acetyltransferase
MLVRIETPDDYAAVRTLNSAAFATHAEANLVEALRTHAHPLVSLVAELDGEIVGHIMFSPVVLSSRGDLRIMGLAPMAVAPKHQYQGIGSALVRKGLDECKALGVGAVVVLGHVKYYPRFGFLPSTDFDIRCEYPVPEEAFMAIELQSRYLVGATGVVKYHDAFAKV